MLRFHIDSWCVAGEPDAFRWYCYSNNNKMLFCGDGFGSPRLRNCVNQIRTITKHFKPGTHCIVITKHADALRKTFGEPLYGVRSGVCL